LKVGLFDFDHARTAKPQGAHPLKTGSDVSIEPAGIFGRSATKLAPMSHCIAQRCRDFNRDAQNGSRGSLKVLTLLHSVVLPPNPIGLFGAVPKGFLFPVGK
jgi:hypothetical protein